MYRFFAPSKNISGNKITIDDKQQAHHLKDVLRLKESDEVVIFDERGYEYNCIIDNILSSVTFNIRNRKLTGVKNKKNKITVACAIPKKSKMDDIIDKLTQLGVDRIIPLETERVIVKLDKHKKSLRLERWRKIALSATKQSQRSIVPIIDEVKKLKEELSEAGGFDLKLIPTLIGERKALGDIFKNSHPKNILVLIGPEGDFTQEEVALAKKSGCIPVTLGDLVLRVETAAIAVVGYLKLS